MLRENPERLHDVPGVAIPITEMETRRCSENSHCTVSCMKCCPEVVGCMGFAGNFLRIRTSGDMRCALLEP